MRQSREKLRIAALWLCTLLFLCRVVGQIEVLLLEPAWLPAMSAWYSGLLPYPWLLPIQIALLMLMSVVAYDHSNGSGALQPTRRGTRTFLQAFAAIYALAMLVRLSLALGEPPHDLLASGIIPVLFHWVLASFLLLVSLAPAPQPQQARTSGLVSAEEHPGDPSAARLLQARRLLDV